jgi:hypothetical protein
VDAFSLGLLYRSGEPISRVGETIKGRLLTNQTTVSVDITITTTLVRAAEHSVVFAALDFESPLHSLHIFVLEVAASVRYP